MDVTFYCFFYMVKLSTYQLVAFYIDHSCLLTFEEDKGILFTLKKDYIHILSLGCYFMTIRYPCFVYILPLVFINLQRVQLRNPQVRKEPNLYLEVVRKVVFHFTSGLDVSRLFPEMIMVGKLILNSIQQVHSLLPTLPVQLCV